MSWQTKKPSEKLWALVLWKHSNIPIPRVMCYDPETNTWEEDQSDARYCHVLNHEDIEYHPLPHHPRFDSIIL